MAKENTEEIKEYSNFIHDFIDQDLEDGVYSRVQTRFLLSLTAIFTSATQRQYASTLVQRKNIRVYAISALTIQILLKRIPNMLMPSRKTLTGSALIGTTSISHLIILILFMNVQ